MTKSIFKQHYIILNKIYKHYFYMDLYLHKYLIAYDKIEFKKIIKFTAL